MASIKKLENGSYQATVSCGRDSNGKQIRKYVTRSTMKECKSAAREIETDYEEGLIVNYKNVRFTKWAEEWLDMNRSRLKPSTWLSYKLYVEVHYKDHFGSLKLSQINEIHVRKFVNEQLKTLSPTTVKKHLFVLSRILQDVLKHKNPCKDVPQPQKAKYQPHIVTGEEFEKIHQYVKGKPMEPIILLSSWCGLRRGEICALKWDDIDWNENTIRIDEATSLGEDGYDEDTTKSQNGFRTIAVPKHLLSLLEGIKKKGGLSREKIFPKTPGAITKSFEWITMEERLNMPDIRFHDLRHYHANWLRKNGVPDIYAAERLGHDIQTLKKIYQHIDAGERKDIEKNIIDLVEKPGV